MNIGRTVFAQLMDFIPYYEFQQYVERYHGNYKVKTFSCWDQFLCMSFAQLTYRESLRDIEACLRVAKTKLYHMGIRGKISRYTLDATIIDLCLSVFPWAKFRRGKAAVKLHTLLDLRGSIPVIVNITHGKIHDVNIIDNLFIEAGAIYIMDRAYVDFARLYKIHQSQAFFVTRAKSNFVFKRLYSLSVDKSTGVQADQIITVTGFYTLKGYPDKLRRISYFDALTKKRFVFLTNNFSLPAIVIANLYKCRWQIELFFKWIKQHLRIKAFYGTTENAVKTQIWIAISIYVMVAIVKKRLRINRSLYTILQILSVTLFEKTPILQALSDIDYEEPIADNHNQLNLFQ